jgi:hypothetical protein
LQTPFPWILMETTSDCQALWTLIKRHNCSKSRRSLQMTWGRLLLEFNSASLSTLRIKLRAQANLRSITCPHSPENSWDNRSSQ